MKRPFLTLAFLGLASVLLHAEKGHRFAPLTAKEVAKIEAALPDAKVKPAKPRKLLVFYLTEGYVHASIPYGNKAFQEMGVKTGAYSADFSDDMAVFTPENLQRYDAVLFNSTTQLKFADPANRRALLDFVKSGKGVIGIHAATDNFPTWPEGQELLGGKFNNHPWVAADIEAVKVDDPANPLSEAFGGVGFWINDEIYQIVGPYDRARVRVLLSLDMSKPQNQRDPKKIVRTDNDFPISWVKAIDGGGRIFYCSLGHNPSIFWTSQVLQHYLDGIQFALGDLPVDALPSARENPLPAAALAPATPVPLNPPAPAKLPAPVPKSVEIPKGCTGLTALALQGRALPLFAATAPPVASKNDPLAEGIKAVSTYDFGANRAGVVAFMDYVRAQGAAGHAGIEQAVLPLLSDPAVPRGGKDYVLRLLGLVGSDASVPALTDLIDDPVWSQLAVNALFEISTPTARAALLNSLATVSANLRPAVIGAIGRSRIALAIPDLTVIARGDDQAQTLAAINALAAIGTPDALQNLLKVKAPAGRQTALDWALLRAAQRVMQASPPDADDAKTVFSSFIKTAPVNAMRVASAAGLLQADPSEAWGALSGLLTDADLRTRLDVARLTPQLTPDGVNALLTAFPSLDPGVQVVVVKSFALKRTSDAEPILKLALAGGNPEVRLAALRGYGMANLADSAGVLFPFLDKSKDEADAAAAGLGQLTDPGFSQLLQTQFAQARGPMKAALLNLAADRQDYDLKDQAYAAAGDPDPAVAEAAFDAVEALVKGDDLPLILELLPQAKTGAEHKSLNAALIHAAHVYSDKDKAADLIIAALKAAPSDHRPALIGALASINSEKATAGLQSLLQAPSVDDRKDVIRALALVHNATSDELLFQAASEGKEDSEKILALRGYLDSIQAQKMGAATLLDDYKKAWPLAIRPEEKNAILAAVKNTTGAPAKKLLAELSPPATPASATHP